MARRTLAETQPFAESLRDTVIEARSESDGSWLSPEDTLTLLLTDAFPLSRAAAGNPLRLATEPVYREEVSDLVMDEVRYALPLIEQRLLWVLDILSPTPSQPCRARQFAARLLGHGAEVSEAIVRITGHLDSLTEQAEELQVTQATEARGNTQLTTNRTGQVAHLKSENADLVGQLRECLRLALEDGLTGLPNRVAFHERIADELSRNARGISECALLVWGIDHFKAVNDTWGLHVGGSVLRAVGKAVGTTIRNTDFAARYGGEEFVVLLPGATIAQARMGAERIRNAIANLRITVDGHVIPVTASCGLTLLSAADTAESAFVRADCALYQAKQDGRNRCHVAF